MKRAEEEEERDVLGAFIERDPGHRRDRQQSDTLKSSNGEELRNGKGSLFRAGGGGERRRLQRCEKAHDGSVRRVQLPLAGPLAPQGLLRQMQACRVEFHGGAPPQRVDDDGSTPNIDDAARQRDDQAHTDHGVEEAHSESQHLLQPPWSHLVSRFLQVWAA
ncbi:uncharacterized protein A4U43_C05F21870 [Asparagus officinalis]|uniref:Uncharacterized protein n=1 Tax=Asparagus officinalis TaxID=4686 RepID=A0A5P1EUU2_ASPOF|nr:uncharacterized protein A4U43_C05F21870 [Asparagus officinalis]